MIGEDVTSSLLEAKPLKPLKVDELDTKFLEDLARRVIEATWQSGLIQWSWGEGVYLLSEVRFHELSNNQIPIRLVEWFRRQERLTLGHINNVAPGAAASRLMCQGISIPPSIVKNLRDWVSNPKAATRAPNGAIEHWEGSVWADTCYMLGTFYLNLAQFTKERELVDFIGKQIVRHYEILQDPKSHLFAHGSYRGETLWNFWGRGNAWMALSSVEFLDACEALEIETPEIEKVRIALNNQLNSLASLIPEYGIWDVLVDGQSENKGIIETSATAGIGAAMVRGSRYLTDSSETLLQTGLRACAAALTYIDNQGVLTRTSAGTVLQLVPFGYSVIRNDRLQLWGQGLALNAITALLDSSRNVVSSPKRT